MGGNIEQVQKQGGADEVGPIGVGLKESMEIRGKSGACSGTHRGGAEQSDHLPEDGFFKGGGERLRCLNTDGNN